MFFYVDCDSENLKRTSPKTENIPHTYIKRPKPLASSALGDQCGSLKDFGDLIIKKKKDKDILRGLFPHIKSGVPRDYFAKHKLQKVLLTSLKVSVASKSSVIYLKE